MRERPGLGFHGCNTLMWPLDGSQEQQLQRPALQAEPGRLVSEQTREVTSPSLLLDRGRAAGQEHTTLSQPWAGWTNWPWCL